MRDSIFFNNLGVSFFNVGDEKRAFESFKAAVEVMKQQSSPLTESERMANSISNNKSMQNLVKQFHSSHNHGIMDCTLSDQNDGSCFVSKTAFMIPEGVEASWGASILLFNLALSIHVLSLAEGNHDQLHRANKLYGLSKELMTQVLQTETCTCMEVAETNSHMVVSILNNMGHVFYLLGDYEASRSLFHGLTQVASRTSFQNTVDGEHLRGLLLNAVVLIAPSAASAA